ncbi:hypothetical protein BD779DRAFT_1472319 [Infundibulicybe gibba]|nr:hypothetical protein BD779DRAFT_1472319 [Infundibulicybe gibba]
MDTPSTIVDTIHLAGKFVDYAMGIKDSGEAHLQLMSEVSALKTLLEAMCGRFDNAGVKSGDDHIVGGTRAMEPYDSSPMIWRMPTAGKRSPATEQLGDPRWPFHGEEIETLLSGVECLKLLLSPAMQISLMEFIEATRDELAEVGDVGDIKAVVSSPESSREIQDNPTFLDAKSQCVTSVFVDIENIVSRNQQGQGHRGVPNWPSAPDFDHKHIAMCKKHATGTGKWMLRDLKFVAWRKGEHNVLWCPGRLGVGKSVMASIIIHYLQKEMAQDTAAIFIYFDRTTNYTTRELVDALLSQLVRMRMSYSRVESLWKRMACNPPTLEELWTILGAEIRKYTQVFVVIDALDESCDEVWVPLLRNLRKMSGVGILATSRDLGTITAEFQQDCRLDIVANEGDLRRCINERLLGATQTFKRLLEMDTDLRAEILDRVVKRADGMFLLAWFHMNILEKQYTLFNLRRALEKLPGDLKSARNATMDRASGKDKRLCPDQ